MNRARRGGCWTKRLILVQQGRNQRTDYLDFLVLDLLRLPFGLLFLALSLPSHNQGYHSPEWDV